MKFSMIGQEECDLLIQVISWAGLTVFIFLTPTCSQKLISYFKVLYKLTQLFYFATY
jgi:hypothetical protein